MARTRERERERKWRERKKGMRTYLNLQRGGQDTCVREQVAYARNVKIGDAQVAYESFVDERFHRLPRMLYGHSFGLHFRIRGRWVVNPLRWIPNIDGNISQRYREVNQVEIEIVQFEIAQRFAYGLFDMLRLVKGIPQLARNPKLRASHETLRNSSRNALADRCFVSVVACAVEVTIARSNGLIHLIGGVALGNLPQPVPDRRNLVTGAS